MVTISLHTMWRRVLIQVATSIYIKPMINCIIIAENTQKTFMNVMEHAYQEFFLVMDHAKQGTSFAIVAATNQEKQTLASQHQT